MTKAHTILVSDLIELHNNGTDCPISGDEMTIALASI